MERGRHAREGGMDGQGVGWMDGWMDEGRRGR